jgi:hypothetical protein
MMMPIETSTPAGFDWGFWLATAAVPAGLLLMVYSNILERRRRKDFTAGIVPALPLLFLGAVIILLALAYAAARWRGV